jgi:hypothetical protein
MATQVQQRRGTTAEHATFTGAVGEVTVDTDKDTAVVHDGTTAGGRPLMLESGSNSALALGSAGTPSLKFTGDPNTGIYSPGADQVAISTNGTGRLFVDASGNVGVGTATPTLTAGATGLDIYDNQDSQLRFHNATTGTTTSDGLLVSLAADSSGYFYNYESAPLIFGTSNTERMRLDSSGRLGLGTSSPSDLLSLSGSGTILSFASGPVISLADASNRTLKIAGPGAVADAVIGTTTNHTLNIITGNTVRATVDTSGNVGIGTTTAAGGASNFVDIYGSASSAVNFHNATSGTGATDGGVVGQYGSDLVVFNYESGIIQFGTNNTERARIDSSGRLLVGTSTTRTWASVTGQFQLEGTSFNTSSPFFINNSNDQYGPFLLLGKSRGTSIGSNTIVQSGDLIGSINFAGADGSVLRTGANIEAFIDGTPGSGDLPTRLVFSTTADGASSPTERMRLDSAGSMVLASGTAFVAPYVYNVTTATAANVNVDASGFLRRSTSSIKYKTNVETIQHQYADAILGCRPVWYQSTCEADKPDWGHWGFIAEEVAAIDPRLCFFKEEEDGTLEPEGVQYDRFVPHLLNLIKRQGEAIAELQAEVAALKAQ